jgi:hypothetical protein
MDALHMFKFNLTKQNETNISEGFNDLNSNYGFVESSLNFWSKYLSSTFADLHGNCSITIIDYIRLFDHYGESWRSMTALQWFESFMLSLMSKAMIFRANIFYIEYYEKTNNTAGIVSSVLKFMYDSLLFENLYYGDNAVLKQTNETVINSTRPLVQGSASSHLHED